eukprot:TRINITY_DN453_c0_g2_i12.p1 TRINITY_DN453_c0_g2~~TRINITY_DN453_c0_g2_i12.p1  ORF type:complete len:109 (-),score=25.11 TRINITY_DN453_c0_g2_i12:71-397(-)
MWKQIQEIRRLHDKAYKRWMPHLNLLYPFVPEKEFSKASAVFSEILADFRPFHVEFHKFDFFSHGKSCTIFLKPSFVSEDDDELVSTSSQPTIPKTHSSREYRWNDGE